MKFIATADWQLGMTAHFLPDDARARFHEARFAAIRRIGEVARRHDAQFVVVAGDVFESNQLDRKVLAQAFEAMNHIDVPIWLLPGNHDPLDAASIYESAAFHERCPKHVHVLKTPGITPVAPDIDLIGAPWFSKAPTTDLVTDALEGNEADPKRKRIIVGHGAVISHGDQAQAQRVIDTRRIGTAFEAGVAHFAVLGDHHSTSEVASAIWYPGTPEVTDRREKDPGNVLVVDLAHQHVEPVRVGEWSFHTIAHEFSSAADVAEFERMLEAVPDKSTTAIWLQLTGTVSMRHHALIEETIENANDLFALVRVWERHTDLVVMPPDGELGDLGLSGFARDAVKELVEQANDSPAAQDALKLLYRLSGASK